MLSPEDRQTLLDVAAASIRQGLETGRPLRVDVDQYSPALQAPGASFVTLTIGGQLRGCSGMLEPIRPLVLKLPALHHRL
jgi:AMMECR1 domain-containing protein